MSDEWMTTVKMHYWSPGGVLVQALNMAILRVGGGVDSMIQFSWAALV